MLRVSAAYQCFCLGPSYFGFALKIEEDQTLHQTFFIQTNKVLASEGDWQEKLLCLTVWDCYDSDSAGLAPAPVQQ